MRAFKSELIVALDSTETVTREWRRPTDRQVKNERKTKTEE